MVERLDIWSERMNGALALLSVFETWRVPLSWGCGKDNNVYSSAIYRLLKDKRNMSMFLEGGREIHFKDHKRNAKGKLVSVEAFLADL